eukprot:CAMPEP_0183513740 /NCGR_PEP_ID=MMETSP0371-20130417/12407_1 /TAXON_ID=268820 /ORGANISM="Peridinium aciculiferum, Strain PAER-2" /LENGTH=42 /DNA_ID= /DNA_START= /DNA_END= /DNA_ORIENTATION=
MKSVVHHRGTGSSPRPRAGMTLGRSRSKKFVVKLLNFTSSGP